MPDGAIKPVNPQTLHNGQRKHWPYGFTNMVFVTPAKKVSMRDKRHAPPTF
jgi:hypothetical protein